MFSRKCKILCFLCSCSLASENVLLLLLLLLLLQQFYIVLLHDSALGFMMSLNHVIGSPPVFEICRPPGGPLVTSYILLLIVSLQDIASFYMACHKWHVAVLTFRE